MVGRRADVMGDEEKTQLPDAEDAKVSQKSQKKTFKGFRESFASSA